MSRYAEYYARLAETASTWNEAQVRTCRKISRTADADRALRRSSARDGAADRSATQAPRRRAARVPHILCDGNPEHARIAWSPGRARTSISRFSGRSPCSRRACRWIRYLPPAPACWSSAGETYFASPSERKRRFHRTLVNLGIDRRGANGATAILERFPAKWMPVRVKKTRHLYHQAACSWPCRARRYSIAAKASKILRICGAL